MSATLRHPATPALLLCVLERRPAIPDDIQETEMNQPRTEPQPGNAALLSGWITRKDLADALSLTVDTLGRWEAWRVGPPCVRAGRMVLYRRRAVQDWLAAQEMPRAKVAGGRK